MTDDLITRLRAFARDNDDVPISVADEAADEIERLRKALQFYADDESWYALDHVPIMGHRWDCWCYGGEVAKWALEGEGSIRVDFEGNRP